MRPMKNILYPLALVAAILSFAVQAQPPFSNSLTQITGNIYRGSNGIWNNLVVIGDDGILLVDTINNPFAQWLKEELATRFPGKDVTYVIYSHSHWDHAEGGKAFRDTATFIAHARMLENMDGRYPHMPGDMVDHNGNGLIDEEDMQIPTDGYPVGVCGYPWQIETYKDKDGDGSLSPAEFFAETVPPSVVYDNRMSLPFGGERVQIIHPGLNHGNDMSVVYFPREKLVFAVDFIADALVRDSLLSLPSACGPFDGHPLQAWIDSYKAVEAIDFDILTTGHGTPLSFPREDLVANREYFEYLRRVVWEAMQAGMSLEAMKASIMLEPYKDWDQYEKLREANIEAAYKNLTLFPLEE